MKHFRWKRPFCSFYQPSYDINCYQSNHYFPDGGCCSNDSHSRHFVKYEIVQRTNWVHNKLCFKRSYEDMLPKKLRLIMRSSIEFLMTINTTHMRDLHSRQVYHTLRIFFLHNSLFQTKFLNETFVSFLFMEI